MGFLRGSTLEPKAVLDEHTGSGLIAALRTGGLGGSVAGIPVTVESAMTFAAVFACVRVLAESVASLPLILYRRQADDGKSRATDHPLYPLLHDAPNDEMSSLQLIEAMMANVVLWGNGCSRLVIDNTGRVRELWPLLSRYLRIERDRASGELIYRYDAPDLKQAFRRWEIFHVAGLSLNGIGGLSVIGYMRRAIGIGLTMDVATENFYGNGARPGIVLKYPGVLSEPAKEGLRDSWVADHGGPENINRPAVLEEGMELDTYGMPLDDAQFIERAKFQAEEVARMFRVQPHKIGILDRATFSNIEHQGLEFVTDSLRPWLVRFEKRTALDLLLAEERRDLYAEFLVDALLRGDTLSRYQAYAISRQWGWHSPDDVRAKENENPLPGGAGKKYLSPLNMEKVGKQAIEIDAEARPDATGYAIEPELQHHGNGHRP